MPQGGKTRPPHTREMVQRAYDMVEEGETRTIVAKTLNVHADTVRRWLNNPSKYDPYLDEVAIKRAVDGDVPVYDNLTVWEREEVLALLEAERKELASLWRGNQHMGYPDAILWGRFGSEAHRVAKSVGDWREKLLLRERRAAA